MKQLIRTRLAGATLAALTALSLAACQAPAAKKVAEPASPVQTQQSNVQQRELGNGLYEIASAKNALWVASAGDFKDNGGVIYKLNPATLQTELQTHTDLKNFALTRNSDGTVLYTTNSLDGGISAIDATTGKITQRLNFNEKNAQGFPFGTREVIYHNGMLWIGGVGDPGVIWVVDAKTLKLKARIKNAGKWVTGLLWSPVTDRIYAANGSGEILVINPRSHKIEQRWTPGDGKSYLFLNMAEDPATGRLFVTDNSKAKATLVFDERSGKVIKQLDTGDSLGIKFNAKRNEIYISQRESGKVLQLDATSYAVKNSWDFTPHPNSLLLSEDGQTLYVTVKQDFNKDHSSKGPDRVVRVDLR
ncbi:hypothetical protein EM595_0190 [Duffyella gerundensis]|uniref:Periplasmic protein n=1 Tax=Duffyella gerundensis TaxID=1619313 RepID=A0A0U5KZV3_9GAMM|nr:YncE family protein [Duffyella gerundensis]CUU22427.1 hypothetical protein EM595_0190 [Duffyella gerundensis]